MTKREGLLFEMYWEKGPQERVQQGDADDEPQFFPGNAIDQARVKLLEEVYCKDVV